jgi:formiminoglutamase
MSEYQRPVLIPSTDITEEARPILASLIGADYSSRAITPQRSDLAPAIVREAFARLAPWDASRGTDVGSWCVHDRGDAGARRAATWEDAFAAIAGLAAKAHGDSSFVIGLGGDHSVSWPLIATAREAVRVRKGEGARLGVVQLDVHHDVRPLDRGPSNGTPMRGLIETGVIDARDLVQIGIHPFANARELTEYCDSTGIRRFSIADVLNDGVEMTTRRTLTGLLKDVDAIYLTVDIDVLDRAFAPGTGAALPGGLDPRTLVELVEFICTDARTVALDVVEFDPERDVSGTTAANVAYVVMAAIAALARRTALPGNA